jgi:hypothetical protein
VLQGFLLSLMLQTFFMSATNPRQWCYKGQLALLQGPVTGHLVVIFFPPTVICFRTTRLVNLYHSNQVFATSVLEFG